MCCLSTAGEMRPVPSGRDGSVGDDLSKEDFLSVPNLFDFKKVKKNKMDSILMCMEEETKK